MPPILSKPTVGAFVVGLAVVAGAIREAGTKAAAPRQDTAQLFVVPKARGKDRVGVNAAFMARISKILPILVPGPFTPEAGFLALVAAMMVGRSGCAVGRQVL